MLFLFLALIHILIWLFLLFGFLINSKIALFNTLFLLPSIYLIHILPFHVINKIKCYINKNCYKDSIKIEKAIKFYYLKVFFNDSFQNPFSPQGLLILAYILNFYYLYFKYYRFCGKSNKT